MVAEIDYLCSKFQSCSLHNTDTQDKNDVGMYWSSLSENLYYNTRGEGIHTQDHVIFVF